MLLGAMNHPMRDPVEEIVSFREAGFDFVDLTLEPARARATEIDRARLRRVLAETGMGLVGHTAWYFPIASAFDLIREATLQEFDRCFEVFAELGASLVNVHPDPRVPLHGEDWVVARNVDALQRLSARAASFGLRLMLENIAGLFGRVDVLKRVFEGASEVAFHLDAGHANLGVPANTTDALLDAFASRLAHVHLSDNKGGEHDLHLPLGAGLIDWSWVVGSLKRHGYDGTITLEVFSPDQEYLAVSGRKLRRLWAEVPA